MYTGSSAYKCSRWTCLLLGPFKKLKRARRIRPFSPKIEFFKMRRASLNRTDWVDVKLTGSDVIRPVQQEGSSCGEIVIKMASWSHFQTR
ncbi:hypothetical protein AMECASPLE_029713 [Ameca splendens]|uniref:Uncharacterized protein n=1 Tax=Ameca splendens TaxID=208324 RepID=A0ABV0XIS6_9TELE